MSNKEIEEALKSVSSRSVSDFICECSTGAARGFESGSELCSSSSGFSGGNGSCSCSTGAAIVKDEVNSGNEDKDEKPTTPTPPEGSGEGKECEAHTDNMIK